MNSIMVVLGKELRRIFTDRRLVFTTFILPMLAIAIMYSFLGYYAGNMVESAKNDEILVAVTNMPDAIKDDFKNNKITVYAEDKSYDDVKNLLYSKDIDAYIKFDENFEKQITNYKDGVSPKVELVFNPKKTKVEMKLVRVKEMFNDYKMDVIAKRLGSSDYVKVLDYDVREVELRENDEANVGGVASLLLPMLLTIFVFSGAMGVGIDSIAGEKERGTFAIMLIAPIDRSVIIVTKILSIAVVSLLSTLSSFIGILISIPFSRGLFMSNSSKDVELVQHVDFSSTRLLMIFVTLIALMLVSVTIISIISLYARSVKEANTYVTPIYMLVMLVSFLPLYSPSTETPMYMFLVPIYNGITSLIKILNGEATAVMILMTFVSSFVVTAIFVYLMRKMIYRESVVFPS